MLILGSLFVASSASAQPATQACLGELDAFLTCPAGAQRKGTECRATGGHWSGSSRQGPAIFFRDAATKQVSFVAYYKDHKKHGRTFRFDKQGRLASWSDMANDTNHGLNVDCSEDGKVVMVSWHKAGKAVGISRHWKRGDGSFSFAFDQAKRTSVTVPADQQVRPDHLCRPATCDVTAKPDHTGFPN